MTRDLGDLMWSAVGERMRSLDDADLDANDLTRLRARVRRGRTVRHVREATVAVPVVAAVAAAGWFGFDRMTATPPADETPQPVQPTPSPDATDVPDEPDVTDDALGDPVEEPGLPPHHELPDGLLDEAGPGWVLTVHRPTRTVADPTIDFRYEVLTNAMFLVAPDGTNYLVGRWGPEANVVPSVWHADSATVDVIVDVDTAGYGQQRPGQDVMAATYDLRTGTFTEREGDAALPPDTTQQPPRSPSGRQVGLEYGTAFTLWAADGAATQLAYGVDGKVCAPVGWLGEDAFLALCVDSAMLTDGGLDIGRTERDYHPELVRVDLAGTRVDGVTGLGALGPDDPLPSVGDGVHVRDGVVAFRSEEGGPYGCWTGADLWTDAGFRPLQHPTRAENMFEVAAADGVVYVEAAPGCSGDSAPATLTAHDLATGTSQLLAPAPADWMPGEPGWVHEGLDAWVLPQ